jgi:hypothetical protein
VLQLEHLCQVWKFQLVRVRAWPDERFHFLQLDRYLAQVLSEVNLGSPGVHDLGHNSLWRPSERLRIFVAVC